MRSRDQIPWLANAANGLTVFAWVTGIGSLPALMAVASKRAVLVSALGEEWFWAGFILFTAGVWSAVGLIGGNLICRARPRSLPGIAAAVAVCAVTLALSPLMFGITHMAFGNPADRAPAAMATFGGVAAAVVTALVLAYEFGCDYCGRLGVRTIGRIPIDRHERVSYWTNDSGRPMQSVHYYETVETSRQCSQCEREWTDTRDVQVGSHDFRA